MLDFKSLISEYLLKLPCFESVPLKIERKAHSIIIFSPHSKEITMSFIQHSEIHFESRIDFEFEHEKYGHCLDTLVDLDCYFVRDENGVYCKASAHKEYYSCVEKLYIDHQIKPIIDDYLEHFIHSDFEFWIDKTTGFYFADFPKKGEIQAKRRTKGLELLRGQVRYLDEEILSELIMELRQNGNVSITATQRRFGLGFPRATKLVDQARVIFASK